MNICLFGATGRVGSIILQNAMSQQHSITALVRDMKKLNSNGAGLEIKRGNVLNETDIANSLTGSDVVISALNTNGTTTLSESMPLIIKHMKEQEIKRIITIGTAGILQARSAPHLYRFQSSESKRKSTRDAEEHLKAYLMLKDSGLDWTVVCPTYLPVGERKGDYRYEKDFLPDHPSSISIYDTADFAFQQLFNNQFIGSRVGLTY
ncbi:NAD(P)H-binding protein [Bacillus sp. ISL-40]|uniref:NAD(P)-dependent oxidoreductase n=1 Tax=unclassified Bacillus (in: firmicutes) TaxID=185979 RepID=UPI001BE7C72A|nr:MULTISPECIES: NAD(P)H-binding protein [unclassified Bacillus (in: firmicutes)]MBT2700157.1 NAD(P)H-binding protein [Bacillus sp. ISL-40]MBT2721881.1 NAD(P)H-binding protein [Bacillus sp. ISL-46]MBT2740440.1 NAD(P)H-binding protein [Bacillus sp. ISL-77]